MKSVPHPSNGLQAIDASPLFTLERWTWTTGAVPQDRHAHAEWQICEYLDAPGRYLHRGTRHPVAAGSFALVPPGDIHCPIDDVVRLGAHYRVWYFDDDRFAALNDEVRDARWMRVRAPTVSCDPRMSALLATVATDPNGDEAVRSIELVLASIAGLSPGAYVQATARAVREAVLLSAKDYLFDHRERAVPLAELALAVGLSQSRLSHAFHARFGISPAALSLRVRTDHARRALLAGSTIADAAAAAGFADQAHLTRNFRRFVGPTPNAYGRLAGLFKTHRRRSFSLRSMR